jgi:hypothetical protein
MRNLKRISTIMMLLFVANLLLGGFAMPYQNQLQDEFMNLKYLSSPQYLPGFFAPS